MGYVFFLNSGEKRPLPVLIFVASRNFWLKPAHILVGSDQVGLSRVFFEKVGQTVQIRYHPAPAMDGLDFLKIKSLGPFGLRKHVNNFINLMF